MKVRQTSAVVGGYVTGIGLLGARVSMAHGLRQMGLAFGASLFEVAGVTFLDAKAKRLEPQIAVWKEKREAANLAERRVEAAACEVERRKALVESTSAEIREIETSILGRNRSASPDALITSAVAQARAGYLEGIAENRAGGIAPRREK